MMHEPALDQRERLVLAAQRLIGTPFRLHGRDPQFGLDCVGVVACALEEAGISAHAPRGYRLRNSGIARWLGSAEKSGLAETNAPPCRADILLVSPGPGQHHLLIYEGGGSYIHAHAGIRKVCRITDPLPWPTLRRLRLKYP